MESCETVRVRKIGDSCRRNNECPKSCMVKAHKILLLPRLRRGLAFHATANGLEDALDLRPIATLIYIGSTPVAPTLGGPKGSAPRRGWTALHCAAGNGHGSIVELLLKHGADAGAKNKTARGLGGRAAGFGNQAGDASRLRLRGSGGLGGVPRKQPS